MKLVSELAYDPNAPRLTSVEVIGDYAVRVTFSDGEVREANLARSFVRPRKTLGSYLSAYLPPKRLGSPARFARVVVDEETDTLFWPDDGFFHVHGEELYERWHRSPVDTSS